MSKDQSNKKNLFTPSEIRGFLNTPIKATRATTEWSTTEKSMDSPLYGPASSPLNYSPDARQDLSKSSEYHPPSRSGYSPNSSEYRPLSRSGSFSKSPEYHPRIDKGKQPEEIGPSRKRARSPFCNNLKHIEVRCDIMNLQKSAEKTRERLFRHMERTEARMKEMEEKKDQEIKKLTEENAMMKREMMILRGEVTRNIRMEKQSLVYFKEDVNFQIEMERHRVDKQLALREHHYNAVNNRVTNLYDNLEYLYEKQKEKNKKVEEFMKDVEEKKKKKK